MTPARPWTGSSTTFSRLCHWQPLYQGPLTGCLLDCRLETRPVQKHKRTQDWRAGPFRSSSPRGEPQVWGMSDLAMSAIRVLRTRRKTPSSNEMPTAPGRKPGLGRPSARADHQPLLKRNLRRRCSRPGFKSLTSSPVVESPFPVRMHPEPGQLSSICARFGVHVNLGTRSSSSTPRNDRPVLHHASLAAAS